jgi:hypothetical protein
VRTRFKADKDSGTFDRWPSLLHGHRLGVRPAAGLCPAASNNDTVFDDDAAN